MKPSVLVTGAGRGIGRAIAIDLAARGYEIVVNYRSNTATAQETLKTITDAGGSGRLLPFDVGNREQTRACIASDVEENGIYWGVVLNAGVTADGPLPAIEDENWDLVLRTNLDSFFNVLKPLIMPMIRNRKGGRIVTMSSLSGVSGNRGQTNYAASKGGLIAATKSLSREMAKRSITVNSVAPGLIETEMTADLPPEVMKSIPMRRYGTCEEVAGVVGFLFSDAAAYITGQVIGVNGGLY